MLLNLCLAESFTWVKGVQAVHSPHSQPVLHHCPKAIATSSKGRNAVSLPLEQEANSLVAVFCEKNLSIMQNKQFLFKQIPQI